MTQEEIKVLTENITNCAVLNTLENLKLIFSEINNPYANNGVPYNAEEKFKILETWFALSVSNLKYNMFGEKI